MTWLLLSALIGQPPSPWQARWATFDTITREQIQQGWTPHWQVNWGNWDALEVELTGDDDGTAIGMILFGRRIARPAFLPRQFRVSLEYRTACSEPDRSGGWQLLVLTPQAWERLRGLDEPPAPFPSLGRAEQVEHWPIHPVAGEDVDAYRSWRSRNLARAWYVCDAPELIVVLAFTGAHAAAQESAALRNVRIELSPDLSPPGDRTPQWPLKTRSAFYPREAVERARVVCERFEQARALREAILSACQPWLALSDQELRARVPPADVPRAFNESTEGCPRHGKVIYEHGTYPWILSFDHPFRITCPVGGESYPDNDFFAFLRSGMQDHALLTGEYVDDGWGWMSPSGERSFLVGYACHWWWRSFLLPAVTHLAHGYLLTGDPRYAHQAAVLLHRIAEIYPALDHELQSRYGWLQPGYTGKILNRIWETEVVEDLALAYDALFTEAGPYRIERDADLQALTGKDGHALQGYLEANLLEEAADALQRHWVSGNYGMHQMAMATVALVRQNGPTGAWLDWILEQTGNDLLHEGVRYALYNLVYRDGMPYETAPGYCWIWVDRLTQLACRLRGSERDLFREPKLRRLLEAPLDLVVLNRFTPAIGDSGSYQNGIVGRSPDVYRPAWRAYPTARFARWLDQMGALQESNFPSFDSLLEPPLEEEARRLAAEPASPPASRVLDGYGLAILNNQADSVAATCYYGVRGGHGHYDRLNLELFGYGHKLLPDLGYPDFMNAFVPGIFTWSQNTVSHCTVVVDAQRQSGNRGGRVEHFVSTDRVHFVELSGGDTYPQCEEYRRALLLVELDGERCYLVDLFRVRGGHQHDYSLHGAPATFHTEGADWTPPQEHGTLAGEDVEVGQLYDDPVLGQPGYRGSFGGYRGSGFQHLTHVQRRRGEGDWWAEWRLTAEPEVGVRLHLLPQPDQEVILADALISPIKYRTPVKFVLDRRQGADLTSRFVSVMEPFRGQPAITAVREVPTDPSGRAIALRVEHPGGWDLLFQTPEAGREHHCGGDVATDGFLAVLRFDREGRLRRALLAGGSFLRVGDQRWTHTGLMTAEVIQVEPDTNRIRLRWAEGAPFDASPGQPVFVRNQSRSGLFTVAELTRAGGPSAWLTVGGGELRTGRLRLTDWRLPEQGLATPNALAFPQVYGGQWLYTQGGQPVGRVRAIQGGRVFLENPADAAGLPLNETGAAEVWIVEAGPGDRVEIEAVTTLRMEE